MKHSAPQVVQPGPDPLAFLDEELESLARRGLLREPAAATPPDELSFCSNDYLGLAREPAPSLPAGSGASRLIAGQRSEHEKVEHAFARWLDCEAALVFTSGYAANVGTLSALLGAKDHVVSDVLNHASLIDGTRLARASVTIVPHLDVGAVEEALRTSTAPRKWVVLESYYSMDADGPDLVAIRKLCDSFGAALVVDEAHALGVLGPSGRGRCAEAGIRPDVLIGTLGKAFGAQGAFVAGRASLRRFLWNRARSFVFSTGLSPASAGAAVRSLGWLRENPDVIDRIAMLARRLRDGLASMGVAAAGFGHVVPIVLGTSGDAMSFAVALRRHGIEVQAIRPPTVPEGTARVRLTVTARHSVEDIDRVLRAIVDARAELRGA